VPAGDHRPLDHPDRHRSDLQHDHRAPDRGPHLRYDPEGDRAPGGTGGRLLHHPRGRAPRAPAARRPAGDRHRLARRLAPRQVALDQIAWNMRVEQELCDDAPFYVLGPLVTDVFPGYDHITSAIGATEAARAGAAMLCYVTPKEHVGLPRAEDVKAGCIAYKIAAHAGDVARGIARARDWDDDLSRARAALNWPRQFELAFDGETARALHDEDL